MYISMYISVCARVLVCARACMFDCARAYLRARVHFCPLISYFMYPSRRHDPIGLSIKLFPLCPPPPPHVTVYSLFIP